MGELTELQTAIQGAIAEDWELVRGTAGQINDPKGMFDLAYRFGWHAANKYHSGSDRIRELEAEVERMRPVVEAALTWNRTNYRDLGECEKALDAIGDACDAYEAN